MTEKELLEIDLTSESIFTFAALSEAETYVSMMEEQIAKAHEDMHNKALDEFHKLPDPDETEYHIYVGQVDRSFEESYRPILRFTEVIYLYMFFETYVRRHVAEIQKKRGANPDEFEKLRKGRSFTEAIALYFGQPLNWSVLSADDWEALQEIAELRNCIVHNAGYVDGTRHPARLDKLEQRKWQNEPVGIEIDRYEGALLNLPITIHGRFARYYLHLLEKFFESVHENTQKAFPPPKT
jgi:hypothetical protein